MLIERVASRGGSHLLEHAEPLNLGGQTHKLVQA